MDWLEFLKWAGTGIAAAVAGGFVYKRVTTRKSTSSIRLVSQKNNRAGGDIIAGNSVKKNTKQ